MLFFSGKRISCHHRWRASMRPLALAVGTTLLTMSACAGSSMVDPPATESRIPERDDSLVQTDSPVYVLRYRPGTYEAAARAVYLNRTGEAVHFTRRLPQSTGPMFYLKRIRPSGGPPVVRAVWACVGGVPTGRLAPEASLIFRVWLGSTEPPHAQPPITMKDRTGLFRLVLELCSEAEADSDDCVPVAEEKRQSNLFRILPPRSK